MRQRERVRVPARLIAIVLAAGTSASPPAVCAAQATPRPAPAARSGEATISEAEYRSLIEAVPNPSGAPQLVIDSAHFRIAVEGESARFEETFRVRVDGKGWASAALLSGSLDSAAVTPTGRGFLYASENLNRLAFEGPGAGQARIAARIAGSSQADGERTFSIFLPRIPVQEGSIELPGTDLQVSLSGGEILSRRERAPGTVLEVAGRNGQSLSIAFRQRNVSEIRASSALAVSATLYAHNEIVGSNLMTDVTARIVPTSGRLSSVEFVVPTGVKPLFLRGPNLLPFQASGTTVRAKLAIPSSETVEAHLRWSAPVDETASIELPLPRLVAPGPVDLYVDFRGPEGTLVELADRGSLESADPKNLPAGLAAMAGQADEVLQQSLPAAASSPHPPRIRLHRLQAAPVLTAQIRAVRGQSFVSRSGRVLSRIEYVIASSVKEFLTIHLPPGSSFWGAEAMGKPILPAAPEKNSIAIPLRTGRPRIQRVIAYVLSTAEFPRRRGTLSFQPPSVDVPISRLEWRLALPDRFRYRLIGSDYTSATLVSFSGGIDETDRGVTELALRAQQAMARETLAAGAMPIVPHLPESIDQIAVAADLPSLPFQPIRLDVSPVRNAEVWR